MAYVLEVCDTIKMAARWRSCISGRKGSGAPDSTYPLYKDISSAETGVTGNLVNPSIVLHSTNLPSISKGSVVLYRQFEVGKIA